MTFNMDAYREWRQAHPAQPLHRDVEESLIIEVAMLRDEVVMLQQEARIRKNLCDGLAEEAQAERAAVVAWLREEERLHEKHWSTIVASSLRHLGDAIERGDHRREED